MSTPTSRLYFPMHTPHFFIVGAPKCGTTAMYEWLSAHPDIFIPVKEIHYFGADLHHRRPPVSAERYAGLFRDAGQRITGDVAVWYLMSETAAEEIRDHNPDARIIIMLRKPHEMLHSLHSQLVYSGEEDIEDFEQALAAETDRAAGHRIPKSTHTGLEAPPQECLQYTRVASFADQVQRYTDTFEHVHVVLHDDIKADAAATYRGILEFIGADKHFLPDFSVINPNTQVRSQAARQLIQGLRFGPLRAAVPAPLRSVGRVVFERLQAFNTEAVDRQSMGTELTHRLIGEFGPDVERLSSLIGRDLTGWSAAP